MTKPRELTRLAGFFDSKLQQGGVRGTDEICCLCVSAIVLDHSLKFIGRNRLGI